MAGQRNFELARGQIPKLNRAVVTAGDEESIHGVNGEAPDPAIVTGDDRLEHPRGVPFWLNNAPLSQHDLVSVY